MERPELQPEEHQKEPSITSNSSFDWARGIREEISKAESGIYNRQLTLDSALDLHVALQRHREVVEQLKTG